MDPKDDDAGAQEAHLPRYPGISARRAAPRLGAACLLLALVAWSLSLPLHCPLRAALVGGFAFLDGSLLGLCLALVTRARRPAGIYFWLLLAGATFWPIWNEWPIWRGWPIGDPTTLQPWPGAPVLLANYYDLLRFGLFLLGLPFPFVRFGHHAPELIQGDAESKET